MRSQKLDVQSMIQLFYHKGQHRYTVSKAPENATLMQTTGKNPWHIKIMKSATKLHKILQYFHKSICGNI